jgi:hypothetical protein
MAYTTINKSSEHFNSVLYTGDGNSNRSVTGVGFQPDWTWIKRRNTDGYNVLFDAVRGPTNWLYSNTTDAEDSASYTDNADFISDGFKPDNAGSTNASGSTYVGWNWLASNSTASNTNGSITSTVSANTTSGFSIVSYTGTGANATVGHGLGVAPKMVIVKSKSGGGSAYTWGVYHASTGATKYFELNTAASAANASTPWNNTAPTSSVFNIGTWSSVNANVQAYIAYCFAEKKGFSKFGSYLGNNNSNGTFVYTGFKPAFVMTKCSSSSGNWKTSWSVGHVNGTGRNLSPNLTSGDNSSNKIDILSNGFKLRATDTDRNLSGGTFIYMAFAKAPLVGSNNVPATAR